MEPIQVGEWVRPADAAAYPGLVGEVVDVSVILHTETKKPVARYVRVAWGSGEHPPEWQHERTAVVRATGGVIVQPSLF